MKFSTILAVLFATVALAHPTTEIDERGVEEGKRGVEEGKYGFSAGGKCIESYLGGGCSY